jgi:hypothetical protein
VVEWRHADWTPVRRAIVNALPTCPLCKQETNWETRTKKGWTTQSYEIRCPLCDAEWEYMITDWTKGSELAKGLALGALSGVLAMNKAFKVVNDTSVWVLRKVGKCSGAEEFLGKAMSVAAWKQLSEQAQT